MQSPTDNSASLAAEFEDLSLKVCDEIQFAHSHTFYNDLGDNRDTTIEEVMLFPCSIVYFEAESFLDISGSGCLCSFGH
jgi:hypothetical protein